MEEEKTLDMKGVEEDAAAAEREAEAAKKEPDVGSYTHTFQKPFSWEGHTYDTLTFDWMALTGEDHLNLENKILLKGRTLIVPAYTGDFLAGMAARACTERDNDGKRVITDEAVSKLPIRDFQAITGKARRFLQRGE